ncbi:MAG TPA: rod shape-determining protein MreD [Salinisphaeraceae bacterium]|nr:rod shape-determining protein MreD [Salinisphaeraceae bacterium]
MIANKRVSGLLIFTSLALAFMLIVMPLPRWLANFWPQWYVITVLFWVLMQPLRFGICMAWCCGLIIDVLYGTPLSQHGLALATAAYLVIKLREPLWVFPHWQQTLLLLPVVLIYEFILFWIDGIIGYDMSPLRRWLPGVTGVLLWPAWAWGLERIAEIDVRS